MKGYFARRLINYLGSVAWFIARRLHITDFALVCDKGRYFTGRVFGVSAKVQLENLCKRYENIVFVDNEDESSVFQVQRWFDCGFFDVKKVAVVYIRYKRSRRLYSSKLREMGVSFCGVNFVSELAPINVSRIFYVFNSISNCALMLNRSATHVFVGHGQSEKKACEHPLFRMYDYLLVAGPRSVAKLANSGVLHEQDAKNKCLKIGMPYAIHSGENNDALSSGLLYAPTWEGVLDGEKYSSLPVEKTKAALKEIVQAENPESLIIRPHPSTGIRDRSMYEKLDSLLEYLQSQFPSIDISLELQEGSVVERHYTARRIKFDKNLSRVNVKIASTLNLSRYKSVICDVSAIASEALFSKTPATILVVQKHDLEYVVGKPSSYIFLSDDDEGGGANEGYTETALSRSPEVGFSMSEWKTLTPSDLFTEITKHI
ncbi:hypothetical protein [Microbulbifer celer]|uniref:CDP-Glycerol:Poly(Glycerophosphate) glycerophosphotransferase n=1 Tax=Microbulbifer celer TaxID=435905 RepID=A0ABW3UE99_9GAMM|nr:hypothetical protein [Microbulbifer celer]UFN58982.1 hypothetical protein LPW13_08070 [Microbulbifer celer]